MADSSGPVCPNCGSRHIELQGASGASVCTECGVVLEENGMCLAVFQDVTLPCL